MLRTYGLLILLILSFRLHGQEDSLVVTDTAKMHSPKKAVIFSAVLPGAGQVYNHLAMPKGKKKAFWKVPLIYGGLAATGYFLVQNQSIQKELKQEYTNRMNGGVPDVRWEQFDDDGILTLFRQYQTQRDLSILGVGLVYVLQVVDAGVEAHFVDFDISEDLSIQLRPTILSTRTVGLSLKLDI
ncbi:MAG: hypothetical protein RIT43_997 [Bacteroidota bacterium]